MLRPRTPVKQRGAMTPKRERPGQGMSRSASERQHEVPIEVVLNDALQFPGLPKEFNQLPRGRKERRSGYAWDQGDDPSRHRSLSRSRRNEEEEAPRPGRARAVSYDSGMMEEATRATTEKAAAQPTTPRTSSALKKRVSTSGGGPPADAASEALAKEQQAKRKEIMAKMVEDMKALRALDQGPDAETQLAGELTQMLAMSAGDSAVEINTASSPAIQPCVEDTAEQVDMRPRRLSNPRVNIMEPPSSSSWEFPLSKEEKKARVVMISEMISNDQEAEIEQKEAEIERLKSGQD